MKDALQSLASLFRRSGGASSGEGIRSDEVPVLAKAPDWMIRRTLFEVETRGLSSAVDANGAEKRIFVVAPSIMEAISTVYLAYSGVKIISITALAGTFAPADLIVMPEAKPPLPHKR